MSHRIELQIHADGRVEAHVAGVKGKACLDYIRVLEEMLEAEAVDFAFTPEYYEAPPITETLPLHTTDRNQSTP